LIEEEASSFVGLRVGGCETLRESLEVGGGLRARDAGIEAGDDGKPVGVTGIAVGNAGCELLNVSERNPELWIENEVESMETAGRDADNGVGLAGKSDRFAEDGGIGGKAMLPESVPEDDDGEMLLISSETSAESHAQAGHIEIVGGGGLSPDALGFAGATNGGGNEFVVGRNAGEGLGVVADVGEDGIGEIVAALVSIVCGVEAEQRGGIADGGGAEDKAAHHGKNGGVGGNAEANGEYDGEDEAG